MRDEKLDRERLAKMCEREARGREARAETTEEEAAEADTEDARESMRFSAEWFRQRAADWRTIAEILRGSTGERRIDVDSLIVCLRAPIVDGVIEEILSRLTKVGFEVTVRHVIKIIQAFSIDVPSYHRFEIASELMKMPEVSRLETNNQIQLCGASPSDERTTE